MTKSFLVTKIKSCKSNQATEGAQHPPYLSSFLNIFKFRFNTTLMTFKTDEFLRLFRSKFFLTNSKKKLRRVPFGVGEKFYLNNFCEKPHIKDEKFTFIFSTSYKTMGNGKAYRKSLKITSGLWCINSHRPST
ncbi:hypothetical protein BpHYR1_012999 [Brachionus plicatilis]|uniref:Uncharacterized protein n=1 Tax=Brachionus plicatilis TaxID=10195 RepID=A0A3M7QG46_BRAPC|nr:hypothetical protein BpHYR1_012999 [Brachionus plicatilis]